MFYSSALNFYCVVEKARGWQRELRRAYILIFPFSNCIAGNAIIY